MDETEQTVSKSMLCKTNQFFLRSQNHSEKERKNTVATLGAVRPVGTYCTLNDRGHDRTPSILKIYFVALRIKPGQAGLIVGPLSYLTMRWFGRIGRKSCSVSPSK